MYQQTKEIIEQNFIDRLSLHKTTRDIYLDNNLFDIAKFRNEVHQNHGVLLENDKYIYELAYLYAEKNTFSPIEDYLNQCIAKHPDTDYKQIFRDLNEKVLHIDSDSIEGVYLPKTLVGAVKRILEPGCQFDNVLIIKGKQGYFKTSLFRELASSDYFDSINLSYNKDDLMICHSKWILELGECEEAIKPYTMNKLKAFITKQNDTYRKPYDKSPITVHRQFILVGTTNKDEFLADTTGNRRFWCMEVTEKIDIEWVKQNRDLIWAAAVQAYQDNYATYLNETEQNLSNVINSKYQESDIWESDIENWVSKQTDPFTLSDVLTNAIGKEARFSRKNDKDRIINILRQLGYQQPTKTTRVNSKPGKYWTKLQANCN